MGKKHWHFTDNTTTISQVIITLFTLTFKIQLERLDQNLTHTSVHSDHLDPVYTLHMALKCNRITNGQRLILNTALKWRHIQKAFNLLHYLANALIQSDILTTCIDIDSDI